MLNKENLIIILDKLFDQSKKYYDDFNSADAKIGDGDLGITILHGLEEIQKNKVSFNNDMGENFMICSKAFVKRSGSSFGTLIAFSLMNISKKIDGKKECDHHDIVTIFEIALKTILDRGKTKLGDKTIADTLNLIIHKIKKSKNYNHEIKSACTDALENFKGKKILVGRARMFEDKTTKFDDPGMFALKKLSEIF
jgi:dihydroxyacetone kinase-like protein